VTTVNGGDVIYAADVNQFNTRVATNKLTADSTTWGAAEAVATSVTATLVSGRRYEVKFVGKISSDVSGDTDNLRLREDNLTGTQFGFNQIYLVNTSGNGFFFVIVGEYTAVANGSKTFVMTGNRSAGTGTAHRIRAGGTTPCFFTVTAINEP